MKTAIVVMAAALLAACGNSGPEQASAGGAASGAAADMSDPSWTGLTHPQEVILARQELMEFIEALMKPIDLITVDVPASSAVLKEHAEVITAMLTAVPHLFPPTTNLYDQSKAEQVTIALPAIWENFEGFHALAANAVKAGEAMAAAEGIEAQKKASVALRAACDACHAGFMRAYKGPEVQQSDLDFDFDAALGTEP